MLKAAWAESTSRFKLHGTGRLRPMRQRPPASPHRTGKEGGVSALALNRYVTYLRHYISLLLSFGVLSLFNAYRNLAHLAQFARVERDSALHCQRTQAMFVLARLPCMRLSAAELFPYA